MTGLWLGHKCVLEKHYQRIMNWNKLARITFAIIPAAIISFFLWAPDALALYRRRLPPPGKIRTRQTVSVVNTGSLGVSVNLRSDRRALQLSISNLQLAHSVSYLLIYKSEGRTKGSQGTIRPNKNNTGSSASREILFGTCSAGVCTYHTGITDMRFTVTAKLKNGYTIIRPYLVRP